MGSRDNSVGTATGYGLEGWGSIPGRGNTFPLIRNFQAGSGTHPASYSVGTGGYFHGGKAAGS
jgi:hypothetical protein